METNKEGDVTLSVVMPAYNEGAHITDNLLETSRVLSGFVKRYEIIAVDDGSADNTAECIRRAEMQDTHIRGISYQPNGGKGHAIRTGIAAAEGRYIAFLDSDLELPPILLKRFLKDMKEQDADIVLFLYREAYYEKDRDDQSEAECIVAKNRHGETGSINLRWDGRYTRFFSVDRNRE